MFKERPAWSLPGIPVFLVLLVAAIGLGAAARWPTSARCSCRPGTRPAGWRSVGLVVILVLFVVVLILFARPHAGQPQRAPRDHVRGPLCRHRARAGPPLGQPVHAAATGVRPRAQLRDRPAEGQRQRRQPHRDRGHRGVAGHGHGGGALRGRRLRELRAGAVGVGRCATWPCRTPTTPTRRRRGPARRPAPTSPSSCEGEIADRLEKAGVEVIEARISHLAYARGDRQRDAPPPAGQRRHRRPHAHRRGRRGHGRDGPRAALGQAGRASSTRSARPRW